MNGETNQITPGERRELRSIVKGQYKVLRAEVKRRADEVRAEIERDLLERYREEDQAVADAQQEVARIRADAERQVLEVMDRLKEQHPDLSVTGGYKYGTLSMQTGNPLRDQLHRAAMAAIPDRIGDANLALDRQEVDLLRKLSEGALESEQATAYLATIPTVGELVPRARLRELEAQIKDAGE